MSVKYKMNAVKQQHGPFVLWKENKLVLILFWGFVLHILSLFSPLSNKAVNNVFYIGVMLPVLLMTRWSDIRELFSSNLVKIAILYGFATSLLMAITLDFSKIKYVGYFLAFLLSFYHLDNKGVIHPKAVALTLCAFMLFYSYAHLFNFFIIEDHFFSTRPWFPGWQLYTPSYFNAYLAVICAVALYYLLEGQSYLLFSVVLSLMFGVFVFTKTRMGVAGLLLASPFLLWFCIIRNLVSLKLIGILILFAAISLIISLFGGVDVLLERGASFRPIIAKAIIEDVLSCGIIFGCGYDYSFSLDLGLGTALLITEHSSYSNQLLRSGLIGLILMLILIVMTAVSGCRIRTPWVLSFIAGCGCLLVEGQALMAQPRAFTQLIFWFPFCMVVLADLQYKRNQSTEDKPILD